MKRTVKQLLAECQDRMNGYVTLLSYRYMNLPIKAEPASLLPVKVIIGDNTADFENVAFVTLDGDFKFVVYPKEQEFIPSIQAGIKLQHPEFKQEIKHMEESENDDDNVIVLTMPPVDKDRYDGLMNMVKTLDKDCKGKLDLTFSYYTAKITFDLIDADNESKEEAAKQLDEIKKRFEDQQKQYTENKIKEIEDAYAAYQVKKRQQDEEERTASEEEGKDAVFNMKMN